MDHGDNSKTTRVCVYCGVRVQDRYSELFYAGGRYPMCKTDFVEWRSSFTAEYLLHQQSVPFDMPRCACGQETFPGEDQCRACSG